MRLSLDEYADSISRRRKLRTIKLELLAKHLYTYLEESRANLSFNGVSQASARRTFIGVLAETQRRSDDTVLLALDFKE